MKKISPEKASSLLASTQQLRTHWSGVITSHLSLAVTVNVAIWSYFLNSYIESNLPGNLHQFNYIIAASALSSIILGLWRFYTRHIDNHLAHLYPDFLLYEASLDTPAANGTSGYLIEAVKGSESILLNEKLDHVAKINAIKYLVESRRIGDRGHLVIDNIVMLILIPMLIISAISVSKSGEINNLFWLLGNIIGFILTLQAMTKFQRKLSQTSINKALDSIRKNNETT